MLASFDWGLLFVAASGTICAIVAMLKVFGITNRIDTFMSKLPADPMDIFDANFVGDVVIRAVTRDIQHPDGSPVPIPDVIDGFLAKHGPAVMARLEAKMPEYIPMFLQASNNLPPQLEGETPGTALANQRWGGGLKAAQHLGKAAKAAGGSGIAGKIQQFTEVAGALQQAAPLIKDLRASMGGGNGEVNPDGPGAGSGAVVQSQGVWCPQ